MNTRRRPIALLGVLVLAISVTAGLAPDGAAAKKKKKGGARTFSVSKTTPTPVPGAPNISNPGFAKVPIGTVGGKKLKGKVISFNTVTVTTTWSSGGGGFNFANFATLIAPNGRSVILQAPAADPGSSIQGPTTETPNSPASFCQPAFIGPPPPPPCSDPDATVVGPLYAGTIGNAGLAFLGGISPNGTWTIKVGNGGAAPITLTSIKVEGSVINRLR